MVSRFTLRPFLSSRVSTCKCIYLCRICLTARFIDYEDGDGIKKIMERFHVERSEAYNRSKNALARFARLLFW